MQERYTPNYIPEEIQAYNDKVMQLDVGKPGKVGIIELELERDRKGITIVTKQFSQVPLQIQRTLYPEVSIPHMAYLYVLSPSGGILQGDRYRTDIKLGNNATAHVTTQGATRIYGMESNTATHVLNISVDEDGYLEYIPDQIIPYKNSRYYQEVNLNVHDDSTMIYSEVVTSGRAAMGESFEYDICYLRTSCRNQDDRIRFMENTKIEPSKQTLKGFGVLGRYSTVGTIYILVARTTVAQLQDTISKCTIDDAKVSVGTSILPDESGIIVRILADQTEAVFDVIFSVLQTCRKKILGAPFTRTRKS